MADRTLYQALPGLTECFSCGSAGRVRRMAATPFEQSVAPRVELLNNWSHDRTRLRPALGPTIPLHCSDGFLIGCRDLAR